MEDFSFYNPTNYIFGKNALDSLVSETAKIGKKVFVTYGGGSIKKNGIYDKVMQHLAGFEVQEFGGIEPNPRVETLRKAIAQAKEFQPDIILAVGGGSTIDGSKLIAAATYYEGDAWDVIATKGEKIAAKIIPLATVLTISATASEVNGGSVITKWETNEKDYFSTVKVNPVFSIVNPEFQYSLPADQTAYGVIDTFSHILEQYINQTEHATVQDRFAEGLMLTLIEWGPVVLKEPTSYSARANIAFAASMALNNLIGSGVGQDWATHELEHVVSGYYDIPHAAGLAVITPRWMKHIGLTQKLPKMAQYGRRVWGLSGTNEEVAQQAINKTSEFFESLGVKMTFSEWGISSTEVAKLVEKAVNRDPMGEIPLNEEQMRAIYSDCF